MAVYIDAIAKGVVYTIVAYWCVSLSSAPALLHSRFLKIIAYFSFGDLCQHDMGTGLPFRPATFDGCISVSALQVRTIGPIPHLLGAAWILVVVQLLFGTSDGV